MAPSRSALFLVACLLLTIPLTTAQQYGSFFTAIYIGSGSYVQQGQEACAGMGASSYCCANGQYCCVDAVSSIACCASGQTCQGTAGAANNVQYVPTTTYYTPSTTCGCESDPTYVQTVTTQNNVVPVAYAAPVTVTTTVGFQQSTTVVTAYSTPSTTFVTQGLIVTTTSPTLTLITTPEGIVTTEINNPGTCASLSTIIAQGGNLPATRNCIVFISQAPKTRSVDMMVMSGLLTIGIWLAFIICL